MAELASGTPAWPQRTEDLAEIALEIEIERASPFWQRLGGRRRVRLELLDYPGEWLLDLPLLSQTYKEWSEQTLLMLRQSPRQSVCTPFLDFLTSVQPDGPADDTLIQRGVSLYRTALEECRRLGLRYLQPGRFLCPGPRGDVPLLWFFPMDGVPRYAAQSSLAGLLGERFEAYKADIRAQFFDTHFAAFDRQIFLVDVLSALHAGKEAFEDIEHAIADIAAHLRYGWNWLPRPAAALAGGAARIAGRALSVAGNALGAYATLEEAVPVLEEYAKGSPQPVMQAIEEARSRKVADDLDAFLASRFGKRMVEPIKAIHLTEEDKPIETMWDVTVAATAHARSIPNTDKRLEVERAAGDLLKQAA